MKILLEIFYIVVFETNKNIQGRYDARIASFNNVIR